MVNKKSQAEEMIIELMKEVCERLENNHTEEEWKKAKPCWYCVKCDAVANWTVDFMRMMFSKSCKHDPETCKCETARKDYDKDGKVKYVEG